MVMEPKPKLTLEEKANILKENGVDVFYQTREGLHYKQPTICFRGDDNEGERAVRVLYQHGVRVFHLSRVHHYLGQEETDSISWELIPYKY